MGLFRCHDQVDTDSIPGNEKEDDVFAGNMHLKPFLVGPDRFYVSVSVRVICKPVDMLSDNPAVFFRERLQERNYARLDPD
jgi:hypothetical protein